MFHPLRLVWTESLLQANLLCPGVQSSVRHVADTVSLPALLSAWMPCRACTVQLAVGPKHHAGDLQAAPALSDIGFTPTAPWLPPDVMVAPAEPAVSQQTTIFPGREDIAEDLDLGMRVHGVEGCGELRYVVTLHAVNQSLRLACPT